MPEASEPAPPVPVLVVDDQAPFRRAARAVIGATPGFEVVAEAESGEEAVALVEQHSPGLVLMDVMMPGINGIEATRRILDVRPDTVVVLVSTYPVEDLPAGADACGAATYVGKEELSPEVLVDAWARHAPA